MLTYIIQKIIIAESNCSFEIHVSHFPISNNRKKCLQFQGKKCPTIFNEQMSWKDEIRCKLKIHFQNGNNIQLNSINWGGRKQQKECMEGFQSNCLCCRTNLQLLLFPLMLWYSFSGSSRGRNVCLPVSVFSSAVQTVKGFKL